MNAEKVLSTLNTIEGKYSPDLSKYPEYQDLVQSLREEIAMAEQKKAGSGNRFKAALRFSKKVNKEFAKTRPGMAGAYIGNDGAQYIMHPHYGVRYEKAFDGLVMANEEANHPSLSRVFEKYERSLPVVLPPLAELKTKLKLDKAEGNLDRNGRSLSILNGVHYDTDLLAQIVELVEPTEAYFTDGGKLPMLVVMGNGASGVVCPVRVTD